MCEVIRDLVVKYPLIYSRNLVSNCTKLYEIEKYGMRRVKIVKNINDVAIMNAFLGRFQNVNCLEIAASLTKKSILLIVRSVLSRRNVKEIVVPAFDAPQWLKINSKWKHFKKMEIRTESICPGKCTDNCSIIENPLLLGVNQNPLPLPSLTTISSIQREVLSIFNQFRTNVVDGLRIHSHLYSVDEALLLNGIMLIKGSCCPDYRSNDEQQAFFSQVINSMLQNEGAVIDEDERQTLSVLVESFAGNLVAVPEIRQPTDLLTNTVL